MGYPTHVLKEVQTIRRDMYKIETHYVWKTVNAKMSCTYPSILESLLQRQSHCKWKQLNSPTLIVIPTPIHAIEHNRNDGEEGPILATALEESLFRIASGSG